MRQHGISQMPVLNTEGRLLGMVHEYDLLNALVASKVKFSDYLHRTAA